MKYILYCLIVIATISLSCCNHSDKQDVNELVVAGFKFGSQQNEILVNAKKLNCEITPNGDFMYILKGNISAFGMTWTQMDVMFDDKVGLKQIRMTRPYDTVTDEMKENHFSVLKDRFPNAEKEGYFASFSCGDITTPCNHATIFDIHDENEKGYSGSTYFILDKNEFSTLICSKVY